MLAVLTACVCLQLPYKWIEKETIEHDTVVHAIAITSEGVNMMHTLELSHHFCMPCWLVGLTLW